MTEENWWQQRDLVLSSTLLWKEEDSKFKFQIKQIQVTLVSTFVLNSSDHFHCIWVTIRLHHQGKNACKGIYFQKKAYFRYDKAYLEENMVRKLSYVFSLLVFLSTFSYFFNSQFHHNKRPFKGHLYQLNKFHIYSKLYIIYHVCRKLDVCL